MAGTSETKAKGPRKLERHFKGVANHRRIQILLLIAKESDLSLNDIVESVKGNMKTIAEHTRRLTLAGLIEKKHCGNLVQHSLTPYGVKFIDFIQEFGNIKE